MIRLHVLAEGHSEQRYVRDVLTTHLGAYGISTDVRRVEVSRDRPRSSAGRIVAGRVYRGGLVDYARARRDLLRWMSEDGGSDARFTTMFDLYALPEDFPGYVQAGAQPDVYVRVRTLEDAMLGDVRDPRLVPYIQVHEFEALVLCDPRHLGVTFTDRAREIRNLVTLCETFANPELINDGPTTAPSKRIIAAIPEYESRKAVAGPVAVQRIPLPVLRDKCPHFHEWLTRLEALG